MTTQAKDSLVSRRSVRRSLPQRHSHRWRDGAVRKGGGARNRTPTKRSPWIVSKRTTDDRKRELGARLTAMTGALVAVTYQPNMFGTHPGTNVRIPDSAGHYWTVNVISQDETHGDQWRDEATIDDRGGDLRLLVAANLRALAERLHEAAANLEAAERRQP